MELMVGEYRITSDPHCFIVEQQKTRGERSKNEGDTYWSQISYHTTLQQACTWLLRRRISDSDADTLSQLSKEIGKATDAIIRAVKEANEG